MRGITIVLFLFCAGYTSAQNTFESKDFSAANALLKNGVNISTIPALAQLTTSATTTSACSIAVSPHLTYTTYHV